MKKIILLFSILFITVSCTPDDDRKQFYMEFLPIESVELPEYFTPGSVNEIVVNYKRPNDCYSFNGWYYTSQGNTRTVAVQALVVEDNNCIPYQENRIFSNSFEFKAGMRPQDTSYLFKFYQGKDASGNSVFLEIEVPVLNN